MFSRKPVAGCKPFQLLEQKKQESPRAARRNQTPETDGALYGFVGLTMTNAPGHPNQKRRAVDLMPDLPIRSMFKRVTNLYHRD